MLRLPSKVLTCIVFALSGTVLIQIAILPSKEIDF